MAEMTPDISAAGNAAKEISKAGPAQPAGGQPAQAPPGNAPPGGQAPAPQYSKSSTTVAIGATFNASDTRKFNLDVTAMTRVVCELVAVPAPSQLVTLVNERSAEVVRQRKAEEAIRLAAANAAAAKPAAQ